jgi:hypothetical protein
MNKETLLHSIETAIREGIITPDDLCVFGANTTALPDPHVSEPSKTFNLSGILYYVGAGIAFIGVSIFVGQHWADLPSMLRILVTLGAGLALFSAATLLESTKRLDRVPDAFHFLAGLLIPGGVFVTLDELGFHGSDWGPGLIFLALTLAYVLAYRIFRHNLLLLFAIIYGTAAFFLLTEAMATGFISFDRDDYLAYRFVGVGATYLVLGYAFRAMLSKILTPWLYGFGALAVLGGAFALQGWQPTQSIFWEVIYPGLVFGAMFLSIHLRSRPVLFLGAAFLVGDIFKLTDEYFQNSLGWSLMLVLAGFLLIGVGYLTFYLNRTYMKNSSI